MIIFRNIKMHRGRQLRDITPLTWFEKIKLFFFGSLALFMGTLWIFGGLIGALVAAWNNHLIMLVLSIFIPGFGAIYTLIMMVLSLF